MDSPTRREAATPWIRVGLAPDQRMYWIRRTRLLAWFTIGYNLVEGIAGITFGLTDECLGVDSFQQFMNLSGADRHARPRRPRHRARLGNFPASSSIKHSQNPPFP
jgi:hypothetical protein